MGRPLDIELLHFLLKRLIALLEYGID